MSNQIPSGDKSAASWTIPDPQIDEGNFNGAAIEPDGGDQLAAMVLGEFDAKTSLLQAKEQKRAAEARLPNLRRSAKRAAKHLGQTQPTQTIVTREKLAELPWLQIVEAIVSMIAAVIALFISNSVLAIYVVNSGSELYVSDPNGARMFAGLALLTALGIRAYEHWLPSDKARSWYALTFFVIGVCASLLWAGAMAKMFAPSANVGVMLASVASDGWIGVLLVLAHVVGDAAWGYLLIASAEKVLLANRKRIEIANPHYAEAEAQAARTKAAEDACRGKLAEANKYITDIASARTALQARIELELDRRVALALAQQEAAVAFARAHFLNTK